MLHFFLFAIGFVACLTAVVVVAKLRVREEERSLTSIGLTTMFVVFLVAGWWLVTRGERVEDRLVAPLILPSPVEVVKAFPVLHTQQALVRSVFVSFERVAIGFGLAVILAVPLGLYMAAYPPIASFFSPLALASSYVPIVVFCPLTLAWWGVSETQKIGFLCIGCFVALLPMIFKTITNVPVAYLDVARTKGASQWQLVYKVLFPVAFADIWDHLRGVFGIGWSWIILAEVVNADKGLGHLIQMSDRRGHTDSIFAVVIVIVFVAVLCDKLWKKTGEMLFPYRSK